MRAVLIRVSISFLLSVSCLDVDFEQVDRKPIDKQVSFHNVYELDDQVGEWWSTFANDELRSLIQQAYSNSPSLLEALNRLERLGYNRNIAESAKRPSLSGNASSTSTNLLDDQTPNSEGYEAGVALKYELDLWGRLRAKVMVEELNYQANREDLEFLKMSLESEVALSWLTVLEARERLMLLKRQLEIQDNNLELIELRYAQGLATSLDVNDQRGNVLSLKAQFAEVRGDESLGLNKLALLLGQNRADFQGVETQFIPKGVIAPELGLAGDLMNRRPDLRASQMRLQALAGNVFIAEKAWYPQIDFSLNITTEAIRVNDLLEDWFGRLVSSVSAPLYDGGLREAELEQAKLRIQEELHVYRRLVLEAFHEIENALVSRQLIKEQELLKQEELEVSQVSVDLSRRRFVNGEDDYLSVIINENRKNNVELSQLSLRAFKKRQELSLFRATGGSLADQQGSKNE
jgi:outer membrane protein, multidrug efflux system